MSPLKSFSVGIPPAAGAPVGTKLLLVADVSDAAIEVIGCNSNACLLFNFSSANSLFSDILNLKLCVSSKEFKLAFEISIAVGYCETLYLGKENKSSKGVSVPSKTSTIGSPNSTTSGFVVAL